MEAVRKALALLVSACTLTGSLCLPVLAEGEDEPAPTVTPVQTTPAADFSDTNYWMNLCTGELPLTADEKASCAAFNEYMQSQSGSLQARINEIESQREAIAADISYYGQQVAEFQSQADALNGEIATLNGEIAVKEKEIEMLEEKIASNQAEVDAASEKIKERMVRAQETMKLNQWLDIMMGARTFDDFIRIANGLADITNYDEKTMDDLSDLIAQLEVDKASVEEEKTVVEAARAEVVDKQNQILAMKYQAQVVEEEMRLQFAALVAEGNQLAADIEAIQATMREITEKLNEVTAAPGWTYPVASGHIHPGAGTWYYEGGGIHLGADFVAPKGTPLLAAGNGVILNSVNGCGDGWLGNGCVGVGGTWGGGNQIDALFKINGGLYAVKYSHMLINTPIPKGTVVMAGDKVGEVGMSGNASGPHSHIEVYYLGGAELFTEYATNWDGNLSFHCDWYSAGLNHICENGASAPCRVRPESVWGG